MIEAEARSRRVVVLDGGVAATGRTSAVAASWMTLVICKAVLRVFSLSSRVCSSGCGRREGRKGGRAEGLKG